MPPYFLIISNIFNRNLPNLPYLPTTHPQKVCQLVTQTKNRDYKSLSFFSFLIPLHIFLFILPLNVSSLPSICNLYLPTIGKTSAAAYFLRNKKTRLPQRVAQDRWLDKSTLIHQCNLDLKRLTPEQIPFPIRDLPQRALNFSMRIVIVSREHRDSRSAVVYLLVIMQLQQASLVYRCTFRCSVSNFITPWLLTVSDYLEFQNYLLLLYATDIKFAQLQNSQ